MFVNEQHRFEEERRKKEHTKYLQVYTTGTNTLHDQNYIEYNDKEIQLNTIFFFFLSH